MPSTTFRLQPILLGSHTVVSVRTGILTAAAFRNRRPNTGRDIPNALPFASCLRFTLTVTSERMKNASSPARDHCRRWPCAPLRSSWPVGGFKGVSLQSVVQSVMRSIYWHSRAAREILLQLSSQTRRALCRKASHGNSRSRSASALDLFDPTRLAWPVRARA